MISDINDKFCATQQKEKTNEIHFKSNQTSFESSANLSASLPSTSFSDITSLQHKNNDLCYGKRTESLDSTQLGKKRLSIEKTQRLKKSFSLDSDNTIEDSNNKDVVQDIGEIVEAKTKESEDVYVHNMDKLSSSDSEDDFFEYKVTHL